MKALLAALLLIASPLWALTPQEVLEDWQGFSKRNEAGFAFERQEGNAGEITLYDVTLGGGVRPVLPWVKLAATPEGTVDITTVERVAWDTPRFYNNPDVTTKGTALMQGLSIQARGAPYNVHYTFEIEGFSYSATTENREFAKQDTATLHGLSGMLTHRWTAALGDALEAKLSAAFWEATAETTIRGENSGQQYTSAADVTIEGAVNLSKIDNSAFAFTSGDIERRVSNGSNFGIETSASATEVLVRGDPNTPHLRLSLADASVTSRSNNQFVPNLDIRFDTLLFDASATDRFAGAHYPWVLEARLEGLVISPESWALIDPDNALPHEASRVLAKLNGIGNRPESDTEIRQFPWFPEWRALELETLEVNFGGLALLARGAVTFQGGTGLTFAPPLPNGGQISLQIQGAQKLLKSLEIGPLGTPFLGSLLNASTPAGQSPDDLDVQILFDETGGISVE